MRRRSVARYQDGEGPHSDSVAEGRWLVISAANASRRTSTDWSGCDGTHAQQQRTRVAGQVVDGRGIGLDVVERTVEQRGVEPRHGAEAERRAARRGRPGRRPARGRRCPRRARSTERSLPAAEPWWTRQ